MLNDRLTIAHKRAGFEPTNWEFVANRGIVTKQTSLTNRIVIGYWFIIDWREEINLTLCLWRYMYHNGVYTAIINVLTTINYSFKWSNHFRLMDQLNGFLANPLRKNQPPTYIPLETPPNNSTERGFFAKEPSLKNILIALGFGDFQIVRIIFLVYIVYARPRSVE